MSDELNISIIGDDFTPAALFRDEILSQVNDVDHIDIQSRDMDPNKIEAFESEEVHEAIGHPNDVIEISEKANFLVITFAPITRNVLKSCPDLIAVACGRGGPVNVNVDACTEQGVVVLNAPGRNIEAVTEFTLAAMINLMREIPTAMDYLRNGEWNTPREDTLEKPSGPELHEKEIGVIGCGDVGQSVGRILKAFGANVLAYDPYVESEVLKQEGFKPVNLEQLLQRAHVITVHARLPKDADPILDEPAFHAMQKKPYIINTARSQTLDHDALVKALKDGRISGAHLDVYHEEPIPPDSPLLDIERPRLHLTPHVAGTSEDIPLKTARIVGNGLSDLLRNGTPEHVLNPDVLHVASKKLQRIITH